MRVIGRGFLAHHLTAAFPDRFEDVTAVAAGVSSTGVTDPAAFDREADLLYGVLDDCRREGRRVLFFSSASTAMYGNTGAFAATEDGPVQPPSVYGRHKLALESVVTHSGVDHLVLRLSHVVGSRQPPHQLLPALAAQIQAGAVTVYTGAHRDLLDVRDLLVAVEGLLTRPSASVVNVASGMPQPVEHLVDTIEERLGVRAVRTQRPGPVSRALVDITRLRELVPAFAPGDDAGAYLEPILDAHLPSYVVTPTR